MMWSWNTLFNEVISAQIAPGPEKLKVRFVWQSGGELSGPLVLLPPTQDRGAATPAFWIETPFYSHQKKIICCHNGQLKLQSGCQFCLYCTVRHWWGQDQCVSLAWARLRSAQNSLPPFHSAHPSALSSCRLQNTKCGLIFYSCVYS